MVKDVGVEKLNITHWINWEKENANSRRYFIKTFLARARTCTTGTFPL